MPILDVSRSGGMIKIVHCIIDLHQDGFIKSQSSGIIFIPIIFRLKIISSWPCCGINQVTCNGLPQVPDCIINDIGVIDTLKIIKR